jgi:phosphoglycolate phosphatase-like HAD superfamily hydrolase
VADRGLQVVLATSAPADELRNLLKVLDADQWTAHITSAEDVETAKPEPGLLEVALDKAAVPPHLAVMLGDAVWDGEAASRAKIPFIGLRSGGTSRADLTDAGAVAVYDDPADLLAGLDDGAVADLFRMR